MNLCKGFILVTINIGDAIADSGKPRVVRCKKRYVAQKSGRVTWEIVHKGKHAHDAEALLCDVMVSQGWGDIREAGHEVRVSSRGNFTFKSEATPKGVEVDIVDKYLLGGTGDGVRRNFLKDEYNLRFLLLP